MSDMHALDAQYHRKCLVALYNRMRQHSSDDCKSNHGKSITAQAETLAELRSSLYRRSSTKRGHGISVQII